MRRTDRKPFYALWTDDFGRRGETFYPDKPSSDYRDGLIAGLTDDGHPFTVKIIACPSCQSDRVHGTQIDDDEWEDATMTCEDCGRVFKIDRNGEGVVDG